MNLRETTFRVYSGPLRTLNPYSPLRGLTFVKHAPFLTGSSVGPSQRLSTNAPYGPYPKSRSLNLPRARNPLLFLPAFHQNGQTVRYTLCRAISLQVWPRKCPKTPKSLPYLQKSPLKPTHPASMATNKKSVQKGADPNCTLLHVRMLIQLQKPSFR